MQRAAVAEGSAPSVSPLPPRAGALYVVVLFTALIVAIVTLAGLQLVTLRSQVNQANLDASLARHAARSGLEIALATLANDPDWMANLSSGQRTTRRKLEDPQSEENSDRFAEHYFSYALTSPTGNFNDLAGENLTLTAYGRVGKSSSAARIELRVLKETFPLLDNALFLRGNIYRRSSVGSLATDGTIIMGAEPDKPESLQAAGLTVDSGLPSVSSGWQDTYRSIGTEIPRTSLPRDPWQRYYIKHELYSPNSNPRTGKTNPDGIYWIDCGGSQFMIEECRLAGTLVLINCHTLTIRGSVLCESTAPKFPVILCDGHIAFLGSTESLLESRIGRNLNPLGSPYEGHQDNDFSDSYPSLIRGLVYADGHLYFNLFGPTTRIEGVVGSGGHCYLNGPVSITFDPRIAKSVPVGISSSSLSTGSGGVAVVPNTFRYVDSDASP